MNTQNNNYYDHTKQPYYKPYRKVSDSLTEDQRVSMSSEDWFEEGFNAAIQPVNDEQEETHLQKEAEEYYQTRKGSIFSTRDEIILAHKAAARKHSVTPVLTEQQIREEAEKLYPIPHKSIWDNPKSGIAYTAKEVAEREQAAYIAALTANSKQHTGK